MGAKEPGTLAPSEDELKELFIKAANELFSEREEILANTKVMMEMVCKTDSLDRDLQDSIAELNIISEQMQIAIAENIIKSPMKRIHKVKT